MDGILIIDKPAGITSHDVVARCRRILGTKKIGHTGTLDPFATGLIVILVGKATRLAQFLDKDSKEYEAVLTFGYETDTGDLTGSPRIDDPKTVPAPRGEIGAAIRSLTGEIMQTPPMYSAKKVDGKKLYELARRGIEIERAPVPVTISELEIVADSTLSESELRIRVVCSAGTYIRTLAEDLARLAGSSAHLRSLRRTAAGSFSIGQALTLEALAEAVGDGRVEDHLIPMNRAGDRLRAMTLAPDRVVKTQNGLSTRVFDAGFAEGENVRMIDQSGELVAIGTFLADENAVRPKIVLV